MVASLKETVSALKSELIITANQQTKVSPVPSFADILKNKTNPAVIIEPKDHNQTFEKTKKDIASNINPSDIGESSSEEQFDGLAECMTKHNKSVFASDFNIKILKCWPTKKNQKVFQALLQLDKERIFSVWNGLNDFVVNSSSTAVFKQRILHYFENLSSE